MNSIMERHFETLRREASDNFLLTGRTQVQSILEEYTAFCNSHRPHQGIRQQIPKPGEPEKNEGAVCRSAVLGGRITIAQTGGVAAGISHPHGANDYMSSRSDHTEYARSCGLPSLRIPPWNSFGSSRCCSANPLPSMPI